METSAGRYLLNSLPFPSWIFKRGANSSLQDRSSTTDDTADKMSRDPEKAMDNDHESLGEEEEEEMETANDKGTKSVAAELLKNPSVMAALQGKLDGMAGTSSGYIQVRKYCIKICKFL